MGNAKRDVHHETNADFYLATPMERVSCTLIVIKRAVQCMAAGRDNARTNKKRRIRLFFLTKLFNVYSFTFILFEPCVAQKYFLFFFELSILFFIFFWKKKKKKKKKK